MAVLIDDPLQVLVRRLPQHDRAGLDVWLALLDRRRVQLAHDTSGQATGVLAAIETVLEYEPITEGTRLLLEDARGGVFRSMKLLGDRSAALSSPPNVVEGALVSSVERLAQATRDTLDPDGTRFALTVRGDSSETRFDAVLIEGALAVLLSNAWKFRRGQGVRVEVEVAIEDGTVRLDVSDDGRGMDEATLRAAGELGFTTRASGVGIGLFLLRRALGVLGGAVVLNGLQPGVRASMLLPLNTRRPRS